MSGWMNWFGGGQARKDAPKTAIINLRQQLDMLQKREKHIENQIEELGNTAKKNVNTNKNVALAALKRKKLQEKQLETTQNQIATLESQVLSIEAANLNYETLKVMESAGKAMKQIHGNMDINKVDDVMDEINEQRLLADQIGESIGRVGQQNSDIDESELLDEFSALQQEALDERMLGVSAPPVREPNGGGTFYSSSPLGSFTRHSPRLGIAT
ncbi:hypothetical protein ABW19_dt0207996 [Dactylella cylindrospora]|nr:hypothetical protein ABW19_dt0207996 [Dactylella cylindrospora]